MRNFYMVRHGETITNVEQIATGQMDVNLTDKGKQQAKECRDVVHARGLKPDVILCSGLSRAKETADIINQELNAPLYQHPELNEQNYGDWEGKHWNIVLSEIEKHGENPPNGESWREFTARINTAVGGLLGQYDGTVLFVTHAGLFKALFLEYAYPESKTENGVLCEFIFSEDEGKLFSVLKHK